MLEETRYPSNVTQQAVPPDLILQGNDAHWEDDPFEEVQNRNLETCKIIQVFKKPRWKKLEETSLKDHVIEKLTPETLISSNA